jgi:hypothetical protein
MIGTFRQTHGLAPDMLLPRGLRRVERIETSA